MKLILQKSVVLLCFSYSIDIQILEESDFEFHSVLILQTVLQLLLQFRILLAKERILNLDLGHRFSLPLSHLFLKLLRFGQPLAILGTHHVLNRDCTFLISLNWWVKAFPEMHSHEVPRDHLLQVVFPCKYLIQARMEL